MKIQYLSDLHLEFADLTDVQAPDADVVVLAGDIHLGTKALDWIKREFTIPVIYICGNHEFYHRRRSKVLEELKEQTKDTNIHFLDNSTVEIDGVTFFGSTLWTDYDLYGDSLEGRLCAEKRMNDHLLIQEDEVFKFSTGLALEQHKISIEALKKEIEKKHDKFVVVTHHGPTSQSIDSVFYGDSLNPAYVSNLEDLIQDSGIKLWFHGHTHHSKTYRVRDTTVAINARGYHNWNIDEPENYDFDKHRTVEI